MKILGSYFYNDMEKNVYLHKAKIGFFYITVEKSDKVIEWFVIEKVVLEYCSNNFIGFKEIAE